MNDVCLERKYMEKLTYEHKMIISQAKKIGMVKCDIVGLLLMFDRRTLNRQKYIIDNLEKITNKTQMMILLSNTYKDEYDLEE